MEGLENLDLRRVGVQRVGKDRVEVGAECWDLEGIEGRVWSM